MTMSEKSGVRVKGPYQRRCPVGVEQSLTHLQKQRLLASVESGVPIKALAKRFGVPYDALLDFLRERGPYNRNSRRTAFSLLS